MSWYIVDVESDGPIPSKYSMISFGAVKLDSNLNTTFYGTTKPISNEYVEEALLISCPSRKEHESYDDPKITMEKFHDWILKTNSNGRPIFVSDNLAYDWQFINYYFHYFIGKNPFGFSGRRIGDLYCGMVKDSFSKWKHLRKTKHTHDPVDDAKGNAEALLAMKKMGLLIPT